MTPDQVRDSYSRLTEVAGETVVLRRYTGSGSNRPFFDVPVRARVVGYRADELVNGSGIQQGDRKVIMLVEDLEAAQITLPLRRNDAVVLSGRDRQELAMVTIDASTRRVGGELIAYELQIRG